MKNIRPIYIEHIIQRILDGRCVPFIGAGANVSSVERGYKGLSLGVEVANILATKMELKPAQRKQLEGFNLMEIAQVLETIIDRQHLVKNVKTILDDRHVQPSPLLKVIAQMPFRLIVSTNYDRLLERALDETQKSYKIFVPASNEMEYQKLTNDLATYDGLKIFKMHGTFIDPPSMEEQSSIIITEDDYIDFLGSLGRQGEGGIPNLITAELVNSNLLLLGYSAKDWDFRLLYRSIPKFYQRKVFIVMKEDPSNFWIEYLKYRGFVIFNMDIYDFADQLEQGYKKHLG